MKYLILLLIVLSSCKTQEKVQHEINHTNNK